MPRDASGHVRPLTDKQRKQRQDAARASAAKRRKAKAAKSARAAATGDGTPQGLGDKNHPSYKSPEQMAELFRKHGVSGASVSPRLEKKSGFMAFTATDADSEKRFQKALKEAGFTVAVGADGSGFAVNAAGQAIKLQRHRNNPSARKKRKATTRTLSRNSLPS